MFRYNLRTLMIGLALLASCGHPSTVYRPGAPSPDLAIYGDGLFFMSRDGLRSYEGVSLVPGRLKDRILIHFPDGGSVEPGDLTPKVLSAHEIEHEVWGGDGDGFFYISTKSHNLAAKFLSHRPTYVMVYERRPGEQGAYLIEYRGQKVGFPIARGDVEKLLGAPDEIKLRTEPPEQ